MNMHLSKQKPESSMRLTNERFGNIDYLRTLCAIFVVYEHFCETGTHNAFGFSLETSFTAHIILKVLYSVARTAVPIFFIISGYLSIYSQKQKIGKVISLFCMTYFYALIPGFFSAILKKMNGSFPLIAFLKVIFGKMFVKNYYLYLFSAVYLISPFINNAVRGLNRKQYERLLLVLIIVFVVWSTAVNTFLSVVDSRETTGVYFTSRTGTSMGFNVANFLLLYLIGGYLRLYYGDKFKEMRPLALAAILSSSIITVFAKIKFPSFSGAFWYYDSFFVIISAISLFALFMGVNIKQNNFISISGRNTFGTYLLHGFVTACVERYISIEAVVRNGILGSFEGILIFVIGVYFLSLIMTIAISFVFSPLNNWWKRTKLYNTYVWVQN